MSKKEKNCLKTLKVKFIPPLIIHTHMPLKRSCEEGTQSGALTFSLIQQILEAKRLGGQVLDFKIKILVELPLLMT
jgi:hypothetical protein